MFRRRRTPSTRPSFLIFHIDRPIARISSPLVLYRFPRIISFTLAKRSLSHWLISGRYSGCSRINQLTAAQEVRDSRNTVTPCIVMKNDGFLYHQVSSFSPESMRLPSLRQSERTTASDPVQHKRRIYPCYRAVDTEHQQRWTRWWCTTPSKHFGKGYR